MGNFDVSPNVIYDIRRAEHHSAIMYRLSKKGQLLDNIRPKINLRSNRKIKFKNPGKNMQKFLKSPMSRGIQSGIEYHKQFKDLSPK